MTPFNWIHRTAKEARKREADYALVIRGSETQIAEGPDALELLQGDVRGCSLFTFCEPGTEVRARAAAAGIKAIYCAVSRLDVLRLIQSGYTNFKVEKAAYRDPMLRPIKNQRAREEILGHWALVEMKREDSTPWLREVIEAARRLRGDYAILVRDGLVVRGDPNASVLLADAQGCVLVTFVEPDVRVLARAKAVGVVAVHCVISQRDACKIGFFGPVAAVKKNYAVRKEFLAPWEEHHVR